MYSTCTFCHASLGSNEMIERFPVGRRLAFDAERGRLWVVCPSCRQWNLSPLDERWEAIEAAERLYRDSRRRAATEHVGLARLRDGTDLVRIGRPLRPEFAAWRYGARFSVRWRKYAVASTLFTGAAYAVGPIAGLGFSIIPAWLLGSARDYLMGRRVVTRVGDPGAPVAITRAQAWAARILQTRDEAGWQLRIRDVHGGWRPGRLVRARAGGPGHLTLVGDEAVAVLRKILPHVNASGGRGRTVDDAVRLLERVGDLRAALRHASSAVGSDEDGDTSRDLGDLLAPVRLALEMAVHEDIERRALDGELAMLESSWKEAEEIAAIADSLTLPQWVTERWNRLARE